MKCSKCGYTSFDYLNECKKCGTDISDVRAMLGVIAISPEERAQSKPAAIVSAPAQPVHDEMDFSTAGLLSDVGTEHEEPREAINNDFITDFEAEAAPEPASTESMVEHTSYKGSKPASAVSMGEEEETLDLGLPGVEEEDKEEESEDDFLDMDFSDVFGDDKKK
jgi:hypothetical protein